MEIELNKTVEEFNKELIGYENKRENAGGDLDKAKEEVLLSLKIQRDSIEADANNAKNITAENWEGFKK